MTDQIVSIDQIRRHARLTAESGLPISTCPYLQGTSHAKRWIASYLMAEIELEDRRQLISTFAGGACEQLEIYKEVACDAVGR